MGPKSNSKTSKGSKQNGNKSNGSKSQPQDDHAVREQNGEPLGDLSMLRKPIDIGSSSGFAFAVKQYHTSTSEVRQYLHYECDVVFECRCCRSMYRSMANFVSHKRVYCKDQYCDSRRYFPPRHLVEDNLTVVHPEAAPSGSFIETWATSDAIPSPSNGDCSNMISADIETSIPRIANYKDPKKDLSQIIEELTQRKAERNRKEAHVSATKFYNEVNDDLVGQKGIRKEHVIRLESMESSKCGVYQTLMQPKSKNQIEERNLHPDPDMDQDLDPDPDSDLMKAQVVEIQNMMTHNEATLGPDGLVAVMKGEGTTDLASSNIGGKDFVVRKQDGSSSDKSVSPKENHVCPICNTRFSTRKTLNHHKKSLHVTFRMCYPCPCCKNTFCNTWSVYRHLYKVHRKTTLQVRKLRSQIVNKAFRKEVSEESQNVKSNIPLQTEADKARKEQQRLHQENQAWMNNFEDDLELQMCGGCGRRFERRAALNSHSQICQKRIAVQNNKTRRPSPPIPTSTSNRYTNMKTSPSSIDRQNLSHAENSKNDNSSFDNTNRLTPLSIQSESGLKCVITPSPSPVPLDVTNQFLTSSPGGPFHRTRHCSGSSVVKKDVPEKRIEIQIRRDYCKSRTSTGSVGSGSITHQQDCNSESNENDPGHEDDSSNFNEDSKMYQSRELGVGISRKDNDTPTLNVCRYPGRRGEPEVHPISIDDCDNEDNDFDDVSSIRSMPDNDSGNRSSNHSEGSISSSRNRKISSSVDSTESDKMRRMSFTSEGHDEISPVASKTNSRRSSGNSDEHEDVANVSDHQSPKSPPVSSSKKEEQFSPIMESRMQSMINIRRLQCVPCQKKFNKLTNLRRHVAVHIGWNRYRCIECPFKCFSKYDCVAHVNKTHLEKPDRDKAQSMVEYIETQVSDSETEITKEAQTDELKLDFNNAHNPPIKTEKISEFLEDGSPDKITSDSSVTESSEAEASPVSICNNKDYPIKIEHDSEESTEHSPETYEDKIEEISDVRIKEEFIVNKPIMTYTLKGGRGNESLRKQSVTSEDEVRVKPGRGRPRKRRASTDGVMLRQAEGRPSKKLLTSEYPQNFSDTTVETSDKAKINETDLDNTDNETSEANESPEDSPSKNEDLQQQTALRKMVLQVIFGAGNSATSQDVESTEDMFALTMNGEVGHSGGSDSSPEPYDVVEAVSSDSTSPLTTGSTTSPVSGSDDVVDISEQGHHGKEESKNAKQNKNRNSVTPTFEIERRQRPVRNRIKVEREDFIYDLSDRCLDPKKDGEERNKMAKRKQDSVKVLVDKSSDGSVKVLPKLMLVRTNVGEYSGVKVVKSGGMSQVLDGNNDKNSVRYNISTRKSQRTFDVSPHKTLNSNK